MKTIITEMEDSNDETVAMLNSSRSIGSAPQMVRQQLILGDMPEESFYDEKLAALLDNVGRAANIKESLFRLIAIAEMDKRGVRFLPKQVIKRALRKHKTSLPK